MILILRYSLETFTDIPLPCGLSTPYCGIQPSRQFHFFPTFSYQTII